ncbi:MAG: hypothetical protein NXI16_13765 [Alphaproteobacteria bacterium]|nr:hypothetical protein [Alphaproteobacteria bacterium]
MAAFSDPVLTKIVETVTGLGIPVSAGTVPDDAFLAGVEIRGGGLVVEEAKLGHPGDVLHEAAHLAVMTPAERDGFTGALPEDPAQEMACHAWCYAAAKRFDLPLETVFHDAYKGGGPALREAFESGGLIGQPMLQLWEMTRLPNADASFDGLPVYPDMAKWLRDA